MARQINFEEYLLAYEVVFQGDLSRRFRDASRRIRNTIDGIQSRFRSFMTDALGPGLPIRVIVEDNISGRKLKRLATEIDKLRDDIISSDGGRSPLGRRVEDAMQQIMNNILIRYDASGIDNITEQLVQSLERQSPVVVEFKTLGVQAALVNIPQMNAGTKPYWVNEKTGEWQHRPGMAKQYQYGGVDVSGYWAFQEFGTSNRVPSRNFILNLQRDFHQIDIKTLDDISIWLTERVASFNRQAAKIVGT
jgi:hypothetical protein